MEHRLYRLLIVWFYRSFVLIRMGLAFDAPSARLFFRHLEKRYVLQTVLGILCVLFRAFIHFTIYPEIYENLAEQIQWNTHSLLRFQPMTEPALFLSYLVAIPIALAVLVAIVLCIVNLVRRQLFSAKQALFVSLPIWLMLAVYIILWLCNGGSANLLIGYPELLLALMLILTLTGKQQPFLSNPESNPLSASIETNTKPKSE